MIAPGARVAFTLLLVAAPSVCVAQARLTPPETVVVQSGNLRLRALLWRPTGAGPFPAVVFHHGAAAQPATSAQIDAFARTDVGPTFQRHGYILLAPSRRGEGLSLGQGIAIQTTIAARAHTPADSAALLDSLLKTEQLDDVLASTAYLRRRSDVRQDRITVAGHSQGGVLALLAGARDSTVRSILDFAGAERSWSSPTMRETMLAAAAKIKVPVMMVHVENGNPQPGRAIDEVLRGRGITSRLLVYPAFGKTFEEAHRFVLTGIPKWESDVFTFLDARR